MSKRDDDSPSDMEVGMTTAERRRRRRRGAGLRVPSDNVPRRTTTPPVVAPVPEDPSLAMSIAYSFGSDSSEPVQQLDEDSGRHSAQSFADPVAPEGMSTVIDPPSSPVESTDFEMKTREMSAVDLEALGLTDPSESRGEMKRVSSPGMPAFHQTTQPMPVTSLATTQPMPVLPDMDPGPDGVEFDEPVITFKPRESTEPVPDVEVDLEPSDAAATAPTPPDDSAIPVPVPTPVHAASTGPVVRQPPGPSEPPPFKRTRPPTEPPPAVVEQPRTRERLRTVALSEEDLEEVREAVRAATRDEDAAKPKPLVVNATQPLSALDIEAIDAPKKPIEPSKPKDGSLPEIDINDLVQRTGDAADSGEFEVDVESGEQKLQVPPAASPRTRPPSVPPPVKGTPDPDRAHAPPPPAAKDHHAPPPPPVKPPTPPKKAPAAAVASSKPVVEGKGARGKPWFVDLFDEDYLRTLPFLTPQATQSEAEFVIDAMGLSAGAQVLDVGCGYGRHAMELAARGFHVVGLDLSTPLLVRGGEEAQRRGLEINFVRGDMRELDFDAQFDGAYCMFSTFGYFDDETNKKTVANIARALKPGGRVMIEILNRDYVIADLPTRVWWEGEGCVVLEEVELNYFSSRIQVNRSVVFDDGRQLEQEISVRAYSLHEVGKLMHAAGFRVLEVSGGYHTRGRFFGNQSRHIIVLAERKEPSGS